MPALDVFVVRIRRGEGREVGRSECEPRIHREEKPEGTLEGKQSRKPPLKERFAERNRDSGSLRDVHEPPQGKVDRSAFVSNLPSR